MVTVDIALATICFLNSCYPALIGKDTPKGEFTLQLRIVQSPGYGGDVLQFLEAEDSLFAVHRTWLGRPSEHREQRLKSTDPRRRIITKGCINVDPEVYDRLKSCCSNDSLSVR